MHKHIDTTTAFYGTGIPPQQKLFKVKSGSYANRLLAVYPESPGTIMFSYSDPPYSTWSTPASLTASAANQPCTAFMDDEGNLYFVYTDSSMELRFIKRPFIAGNWMMGTEYTVCNDGENYYPSLVKEDSGKLWVGWCHLDTSSMYYTIRVKDSDDDGATWGTGPGDIGAGLSIASSYVGYAALVITGGYLNAVYWSSRTSLNFRKYPLGGGTWTDAEVIWYTNSLEFHFSAAGSSDGRLGVAFYGVSGYPGIKYKEYNGAAWSGIYPGLFGEQSYPQLRYIDNIPYIVFTEGVGNNQELIKYSYLSGQSFVNPKNLIGGTNLFDKVYLYDDDGSPKYYQRTIEAGNSGSTADVYHPSSGAMIKDNGDVLYLGMDKPFYFIHAVLSTAGIGGIVTYSYWNGTEWDMFIPFSGAYNFDSTSGDIVLWDDMDTVPVDWQKNSIEENTKFWIKIEVTTAFTTAPVGSQLTSVPECKSPCMIANL
ncbi:MAG: hypothetical protein GF307_11750 [candidate division Zixibacteria bacterium]|nr:hypothetical protein [candidate division Zixibacteria bacterium]